MSPQESQHTNGGTRDCGRFFIDVIGQYPRANVQVRWTDDHYEPDPAVRTQIEEIWAQRSRKALEDNIRLYDGPLCRLMDYSADDSTLSLTLGPTSYKAFLGTNITQANLRYMHGLEALANPLGVSAAIRTTDGFLVMGKRSDRVLHYPGRIHPIGGMVERNADVLRPDPLPDPFQAILSELMTELNIAQDKVADILCMGLVREKPIVQPEMVFDISVNLDAQVIRRQATGASEADEHTELLLLRDYPSSVIAFLDHHAAMMTPVGMAVLLLHGLRHWGSGWFASARGFLQSVI